MEVYEVTLGVPVLGERVKLHSPFFIGINDLLDNLFFLILRAFIQESLVLIVHKLLELRVHLLLEELAC